MQRRIPIALFVAALALRCATIASVFSDTQSSYRPPEPERLAERIASENFADNGVTDHFAVLIGANTELRHRGNLSLAYQVLLEQGYDRRHVYILDSEGESAYFPATDTTSRSAVELLFAHLERSVEPADTLFIYVTGHGRRIRADASDNGKSTTLGISTVTLNPSEELSQDEFAVLLENVKPEVGIAFFDHCYWGPFSSASLCNYVTITTTDHEETSHGVSFPRAFWSAFRERDEKKGPPSIFDAFKFAMVADRATRLGQNRPRISHGCVNPSNVYLLGGRASREVPVAPGVSE